MKKQLNRKGFTLIEVVLVLAIGGLIFLLAFIAFRQASINRRDTARRSDASRFIAEVANYMGDTGKLPNNTYYAFLGNFVPQYLAPWKDPRGKDYSAKTSAADVITVSDYYYASGKKCDGSSVTTGDANDYVILMKLEKGIICRDSGN